MTDIVERLRDASYENAPSRCMEAAREIERQRETVNTLTTQVLWWEEQYRLQEARLDEADPMFCAMVNAARDEHIRLKGFAPITADIIAMLKVALAVSRPHQNHEAKNDPSR